eukprot:scaffold544_cov320-Pavlova_lutheri.AAC.3
MHGCPLVCGSGCMGVLSCMGGACMGVLLFVEVHAWVWRWVVLVDGTRTPPRWGRSGRGTEIPEVAMATSTSGNGNAPVVSAQAALLLRALGEEKKKDGSENRNREGASKATPPPARWRGFPPPGTSTDAKDVEGRDAQIRKRNVKDTLASDPTRRRSREGAVGTRRDERKRTHPQARRAHGSCGRDGRGLTACTHTTRSFLPSFTSGHDDARTCVQLAGLFGPEGILRVLQMTLDHWERTARASSGSAAPCGLGKDTPHAMVVAALLDRLSTFTQQERIVGAVVARAMMGNGRKPQDEIVADLCRAGKLSLRQQIAVALTLVETNDPEWKLEGAKRRKREKEAKERNQGMDRTDPSPPATTLYANTCARWRMGEARRSKVPQSQDWRNPRTQRAAAGRTPVLAGLRAEARRRSAVQTVRHPAKSSA